MFSSSSWTICNKELTKVSFHLFYHHIKHNSWRSLFLAQNLMINKDLCSKSAATVTSLAVMAKNFLTTFHGCGIHISLYTYIMLLWNSLCTPCQLYWCAALWSHHLHLSETEAMVETFLGCFLPPPITFASSWCLWGDIFRLLHR